MTLFPLFCFPLIDEFQFSILQSVLLARWDVVSMDTWWRFGPLELLSNLRHKQVWGQSVWFGFEVVVLDPDIKRKENGCAPPDGTRRRVKGCFSILGCIVHHGLPSFSGHFYVLFPSRGDSLFLGLFQTPSLFSLFRWKLTSSST